MKVKKCLASYIMVKWQNVSVRERASKMAGQVKVLAVNPYDLSSVPSTHMMKGENRFPQVSSTCILCKTSK